MNGQDLERRGIDSAPFVPPVDYITPQERSAIPSGLMLARVAVANLMAFATRGNRPPEY